MRFSFVSFLLLIFLTASVAQQLQVVSHIPHSDSSLYSIAKVNNNEYWTCGKHGLLKKIDSLGNISSIELAHEGLNILKIVPHKNYLYLLTNNAVIFRYDTISKVFTKKKFSTFKNRCFYDMVPLNNGKLMVSGGATAISKGKKALPQGYIAMVDENLEEIVAVWKSYRKFVWSLLKLESGVVLASTFNGQNSHVITTSNYTNWTRDSKIKGLVYALNELDGNVWYSGAKSIYYKKNGIYGIKGETQYELKEPGCLWAMAMIKGKLALTTTHGKLLLKDMKTTEITPISTPTPFCIYALHRLSDNKYMLVGNELGIFIVDFKQGTTKTDSPTD